MALLEVMIQVIIYFLNTRWHTGLTSIILALRQLIHWPWMMHALLALLYTIITVRPLGWVGFLPLNT